MAPQSATSFDPRVVQDTLRQIQSLAAEVGRLARSDLAADEFYREFLARVVAALGAVGGAVWTLDENDRLCLQSELHLEASGLRADPQAGDRHGRLLGRVLAENRPLLLPPHTEATADSGDNPTDHQLMLGPFGTESSPAGVLEIVQRPGQAPGVQQSQHRFLMQMLEHAGDFLRNLQRREFSDQQALWTQLNEFTRSVHASLDPLRTAFVLANEGRRLIDCDRVSVAVCRGRQCVIQAVSGQDLVDRRSNTVRLLEKLATQVVRSGQPLWFTGDTTEMAPQLERTVAAYVDQAQSKAVGVVPLLAAEAEEGDDDRRRRVAARPKPLGAVVVERIDDSRLAPELVRRAEVICGHGAVALGNALQYRSLFLLPLWRALGQAGLVVQLRTLPKTLAVVGLLAGLVAWLTLSPTRLELEARGSLQPVLRRDVFAGVDGRVDEVHVQHLDRVEGPDPQTGRPGTLLAVLTNNELDEEIARITGQRSTIRQQIATIQRSLLEERLMVPEQNRLSGELAQLREKLHNLDTQWELLQRKRSELAVHSPIAGEVVTWDAHNLLIHRPVRRGQRLLRVAHSDGPWRLELEVPEDRIGHILEAQEEARLKGGGDDGRGLRVGFILATDPESKYEGTIEEIHHTAEVRSSEGNTVLVKVRIDKTKLPHRMPGAGVIAKIDCGQCSMGYRLLHDVLAWGRRTLFRL